MFNLFRREPIQHTFINCELCGYELVSSDSLLSDTYDENGNNHVVYKCKHCEHECDYNFDIAPVPIKWSEISGVV
jgi:transcription elongation factor Elf1